MKKSGPLLCGFLALTAVAAAADDFFDRLDDTLTLTGWHDQFRARLSGSLDLEAYHFQQPAPGLLYASGDNLFNPRVALFLDAQFGPHLYGFIQARADRGFDPSDEDPRIRLDEYAVRYTPREDGLINVQVGKFATVVGNWIPRHGSWGNPFVTAPLPYENLTGIWDVIAARSATQLQVWAHLRPPGFTGNEYKDKRLRTPIIWGPDYAPGAAVFGVLGRMKYAVEIKDAALSSHPEAWSGGGDQWAHPSYSGRLGYQPSQMWELGLSASTGPYLRPAAEATLAPGHGRAEYRETVLGQDISFAWHHLQVWTELYAARFAIPLVGQADTFAYYTEAKYKFTPQFFGAIRWNQQLFAGIDNGSGGRVPWGRDVWRIDFAPGYRFTPHAEAKLQYSRQHDAGAPRADHDTFALQWVTRF